MVLITDLLTDTKNGSNPVVTTVASARSIGGTTLSLDDTTGWPTATPVHFITYRLKSNGLIDKTTQIAWKGIVSGTTVGSLTLTSGSDLGNAGGDYAELAPTPAWAQDLASWGHVHANEDGTLKTNIVTTAVIQDANITTSKIANASITNALLATTAGELGGPWQPWTPSFSGITIGNGTLAGYYTQVGKTVTGFFSFTLGSTSAISANPYVSLPTSYNDTHYGHTGMRNIIGEIYFYASVNYKGVLSINAGSSSNTAQILCETISGSFISFTGINSTTPNNFATGHTIACSFQYEVA